MSFGIVVIALIWGIISGYLIFRTLESLLGISFCLHGLLLGRWKRLQNKAAAGVIKPKIILGLMLRLTIYVILFGSLLQFGYNFTRQELRFDYGGNGAILCAVFAVAIALSRMKSSWLRLLVIWKISHQFDYAEKRQRTRMLKS